MAVTVSGTSITFNDSTVQSTAASAPTTDTVLAATAGVTAGAVGSYMYAMAWGTTAAWGGTIAGSSLRPSAAVTNGTTMGGANVPYAAFQGGTWRVLGQSGSYHLSLYCRIS